METVASQPQTAHLLDSSHPCHDMRALYHRLGLIPTSTRADTVLIRSHIAHWIGLKVAEICSIRPSRGHSYRIALWGQHDRYDAIVRITDHYDHVNGVSGISERIGGAK